MARKKTKAGADMLASVMEAATENAAPAAAADTVVAADVEKQIDEPVQEPDILVKNKMQLAAEIKYDDLCVSKEEIVRLTKENEQLKDKMSEYIEAISKLERENKSIQKDYDDSLMKISELSFEVAQLKASLNEIASNNQTKPDTSSNQKPLNAKSTPVPYHYHNNGYSDWN